MSTRDIKGGRGGRPTQVKNKAPAPVQITSEQILREAMEFVEAEVKPATQKITDPDELAEYRLRKRKEFEDHLRRERQAIGTWLNYAKWEASQNEFDRARSVYERALDVDYRNTSIWLRYAEMEMKNRFVNSARNVWDRAVTLLPRFNAFWYKYAHMEEMLGNIANTRQVFERWMEWMPDHNAWRSYIKMELRHHNLDRARDIYERYLVCHNEVQTYVKYAKFEEKNGAVARARHIFERALTELGDDGKDDNLLVAFAKFEERCREYERARVVYRYALETLPKSRIESVYQMYTSFEKQHGDREGLENVIISKRRLQYQEELDANPHNYDTWFDYIRLEQEAGDIERVRDVFQRAIANVPLVTEKRFWRRYIYLWISFAVYEELEAKDYDRVREIFNGCLNVIPHQDFTFAKVWIMFAHFEIRRGDLQKARQILGTAIGKCPKDKLFKAYISLEAELAETDRCRQLYGKYLEWSPENCRAWTDFAAMETSLSEVERARAIYELAVNQPALDMPEMVWKAYIDFEIALGEHQRTRQLYNRLLERTKHVKVWISMAQFEASVNAVDRARKVFEDAEEYFKEQTEAGDERVVLLDAWRDFERSFGTADSVKSIDDKMPRRVKKLRPLVNEAGEEVGSEEYFHYVFPDEESNNSSLAILEMARKWKQKQLAAAVASSNADSVKTEPMDEE